MKQIALAFHQYIGDNDERLPLASDWGPVGVVGQCPAYANEKLTWVNKIYPYVKNRQVFSCPSASTNKLICGESGTNNMPFAWTGANEVTEKPFLGAFYCGGPTYAAYGYNTYYLGGVQYMGRVGRCLTAATVVGSNIEFGQPAMLSQIAVSDRTVLIAENSYSWNTLSPPAFFDYPQIWAGNSVSDSLGDNSCTAAGGLDSSDSVPLRHLEGLNVAFLDGHVKWMKKTALLYRPDHLTTGSISCASFYNNTDPDFLWNRY